MPEEKSLVRLPDVFLDRLLTNLTQEKANQLAELAGIQDEYKKALQESHGNDPYRSTPDYKSSLLEALVRKQESGALESLVEMEVAKKDVSLFDKAGSYLSVYTKGALKGIGKGLCFLAKTAILPFLPGKMVEGMKEYDTTGWGLYHLVGSTLIDGAFIGESAYFLSQDVGQSVGLGALGALFSMCKLVYITSAEKFVGSLVLGPVTYPLYHLGKYTASKIQEMNQEAQKSITEKRKKLLLQECSE